MKKISPIQGWRNYKQIYSLCGLRCVECKKVYYPKKYLCVCGCTKFENYKFSDFGKIVTFTQEKKIVGIVELEQGVKILAQIVDADIKDLKIGMPVRAVFRKLSENGDTGIISYGIKFSPVL